VENVVSAWQWQRWFRGGVGVLVLCLIGFAARVALAQSVITPTTPNPLPGSQFQGGDGNQDNASGLIDWQGFQADGRVGHTSDPQANDDIFAGGTEELKPGGWSLTTKDGGAAPPKDNILDIYRGFDHPQNGDAFLYLAFTREAGDGTTFVTFELNQDPRRWGPDQLPCRTTGDILITFDQQGNGAEVQVDRWETKTLLSNGCANTGSLVPASNLNPNVDVQGSFNNSAAINNYLPGFFPIGGNTIPVRQFGETAINLTSVLGGLGQGCTVFASSWAHSRSSLSDTSQLKDYVAPQPFRIRTCKASPAITSSASGIVKRKARGKHRLRRHLKVTKSLTIHDTATLTGGDSPTGTITWQLFRSATTTADCSGTPVFTDTATVTPEVGSYHSGSYAVTAPGTYAWVVAYSGDNDNNAAGPTKCGNDAEAVAISKATPKLVTKPSGPLRSRRVVFGPRRHRRHRTVRVRTGRAGGAIYDTATLSGSLAATGSITFDLYTGGDCSGPVIFTDTVPVNGDGTYPSASHIVTSAGTYRWVATYSGDALNNKVASGCDDEIVQISKASPQLLTNTSGATELGSPISDSATLTGSWDATGTITFALYGPNPTDCSTPIFTSSSVTVHGDGTYPSESYTPTSVGTYRWVASYSGDPNNNAVSSSCDDPAESQVVGHPSVQPTLTTQAVASALAQAGSPIRDTATLSGGSSPTGTITFNVYGPNDDSCKHPAAPSATVPVSGNGTYNSPTFTPTLVGTYRWIASYSGDDTNKAVDTHCNDALETIVVNKARPSASTLATPSVTVPGDAQDSATLSGAANPSGTITFDLFGPGDSSCSGIPVFSSQVTVVANGTYTSGAFAPELAGTYHWVATYSGDDNNNLVANACGATGESTVVLPSQPTLSTSASPPAHLHRSGSRVRAAGQPIYDSATLSGGFHPTGDITFDLYGPGDTSCSAPIFSTQTIVNGAGIYNSEPFTPTASGTYRWQATYSGDANNNKAGPTGCGDPSETVQVTVPSDTSLITSASDAVALGGAVHDTATLSGGVDPTGHITFDLYAPSDSTCTSRVVFTSTVAVSGNGDYTSASFVPPDAGAYHWVASYSGDAVNHPSGTSCGDPGESVVVRPPSITPVAPTLSTTASPSTGVGAAVYDTAHLSGGTSPSGAITFMLFGPSQPACTGTPVFTTTSAASGNGDYRSAAYNTTQVGTYRWVASYSGDAMNLPAGPTGCGDTAEMVSVTATAVPSPGPDVGAAATTRPKHKAKHKKKTTKPAFTG
jgi:hypothetical protein